MQDLKKQEQFELEVLDALNSKKLLNNLVFSGGTMLRLCFGLNRFSVDMDFWTVKTLDQKKLFENIKTCLASSYTVRDAAEKFYTLLFEIKSPDYPSCLKIEIRREPKKIRVERAIAYSRYSNRQVFLQVVSLQDMLKAKIKAFLARKEIRDVFDLEFLVKRGIMPDESPVILEQVLKGINTLVRNDYTLKLIPLLEKEERAYYLTENFKILKAAIQQKLDSLKK